MVWCCRGEQCQILQLLRSDVKKHSQHILIEPSFEYRGEQGREESQDTAKYQERKPPDTHSKVSTTDRPIPTPILLRIALVSRLHILTTMISLSSNSNSSKRACKEDCRRLHVESELMSLLEFLTVMRLKRVLVVDGSVGIVSLAGDVH